MEFESCDDDYNYHNCYATQFGFRVRVKSSWFKPCSKEKYGALLLQPRFQEIKRYESCKKCNSNWLGNVVLAPDSDAKTMKLYRAPLMDIGNNVNTNLTM
ncbi:hypothetical protein YC2023_044798 [Brassica napus]